MQILSILISIASMVVLLYLSSWFSGTETAITKLSSARIAVMKKNNERNVRYIIRIKRDMDHAIATLLIGNNLVTILLATISALIANMLFHKIGVTVAVGVLTLIVVIFGEITPKANALFNAKRVAQDHAKILYYAMTAIRPLTTLLLFISRGIIRAGGGSVKKDNLLVSEDSIKSLATLGESEGVITTMERDLIHSVFHFGNRRVSDVLVPMCRVFTVKDTMGLVDVRERVAEQQYTRVPVLNDHGVVIGVIYSKDLVGKKGGTVASLMRKPFMVLESAMATTVFHDMKKKRIHLGVVQDAEGKHIGIVTLEDILEELVGEIFDEHDDGSKKPSPDACDPPGKNAARSKRKASHRNRNKP